jgi:hypothetical protein
MSFSTRFESVIITDLVDGQLELLDRLPSEAESGWDSVRDRYLFRHAASGIDPNAALQASGLGRGVQLAGLNAWIVSRNARCRARGIFEIEATALGLLSARGYRVRYDAATATSTVSPLTSGPDGPQNRAQVEQGTVTADIEYIRLDTMVGPEDSGFPTELTGTSASPPAGWVPVVPDSPWTSIGSPVYHYPSGWVLSGVGMENLPGLDFIWLVRERYRYQEEYLP